MPKAVYPIIIELFVKLKVFCNITIKYIKHTNV